MLPYYGSACHHRLPGVPGTGRRQLRGNGGQRNGDSALARTAADGGLERSRQRTVGPRNVVGHRVRRIESDCPIRKQTVPVPTSGSRPLRTRPIELHRPGDVFLGRRTVDRRRDAFTRRAVRREHVRRGVGRLGLRRSDTGARLWSVWNVTAYLPPQYGVSSSACAIGAAASDPPISMAATAGSARECFSTISKYPVLSVTRKHHCFRRDTCYARYH